MQESGAPLGLVNLGRLPFLYSCFSAGGEEMAGCMGPFHSPVFTLPVSFNYLFWRRIRRNTLGVRKRVESLLCDCIRPDLPFG